MTGDDKAFSQAIEIYSSGLADKFHIARSKLSNLEITPERGIALLELAAKIAETEYRYLDPRRDIIELAGKSFDQSYLSIIPDRFLGFGNDGQAAAIRLLAQSGEEGSVEAIKRAITSAADKGRLHLPFGVASLLSNEIEFADLPYLAWLKQLSPDDHLNAQSLRLIIGSHVEKGNFSAKTAEDVATHFIGTLPKALDAVVAMQQANEGPWLYAPDYIDLREETYESISILQEIGGSECLQVFQKALVLADNRIKLHAALAIARLEGRIPQGAVDDISASREMRCELFDYLVTQNEVARMPSQFRTQLALAESDLVRWLTFPTELGTLPNEIAFLGKASRLEAPGKDFYYFRFRSPQLAEEGKVNWQVGWSGPFNPRGPIESHGSGTFSEFKDWDGMVPQNRDSLLSRVAKWFSQ